MNPQPDTHIQLRGRWLLIARGAWIALVGLILVMYVLGVPVYYDQMLTVCAGDECLSWQLSPEEARELQERGVSLESRARNTIIVEHVVKALVYSVIAGVIFWRKSDDWMALLVSFLLVFLGDVYFHAPPEALRTQSVGNVLFQILMAAGSVPFVLLFYLFPDGRFVPRWTRYLALLVVLAAVLLFVTGLGLLPSQFEDIGVLVLLGSLVVGVFAQIYRYVRVSGPIQRLQTKWIVFVFAVTVGILAVSAFGGAEIEAGSALYPFLNVLFGFVIFFIPLSFAISILRYRLFDIDALINRTMVYGALTGALALVYFGSVVLLQGAFRALTGQESQLAVVASTLAIAALFNPLRRRIQDLIDRRFYRRKYDAEQVLAQFAATVRDEVDLDKLTAELLRVVEETMQPEFVSLWLRNPGDGTVLTVSEEEKTRKT